MVQCRITAGLQFCTVFVSFLNFTHGYPLIAVCFRDRKGFKYVNFFRVRGVQCTNKPRSTSNLLSCCRGHFWELDSPECKVVGAAHLGHIIALRLTREYEHLVSLYTSAQKHKNQIVSWCTPACMFSFFGVYPDRFFFDAVMLRTGKNFNFSEVWNAQAHLF